MAQHERRLHAPPLKHFQTDAHPGGTPFETSLSQLGIPELTRGIEYELSGKVALVTGGSSGIGRAIALKLALHGAQVAIVSTEKSRETGVATLADLKLLNGGENLYVAADLTQEDSGDHVVSEVVKKFGRLDVVVNNAGITRDGLLIAMKPDQWNSVIDTNLKSAYLVTRAAVRRMIRQDPSGGSIIFLSSIAAHGNPGQANYSASKAGMEGFAKSVAVEYAERGIRSNAIEAGLARTRLAEKLKPEQQQALIAMSPLKRLLEVEEIAEVALFLASDRSSVINGTVINADGGMIR